MQAALSSGFSRARRSRLSGILPCHRIDCVIGREVVCIRFLGRLPDFTDLPCLKLKMLPNGFASEAGLRTAGRDCQCVELFPHRHRNPARPVSLFPSPSWMLLCTQLMLARRRGSAKALWCDACGCQNGRRRCRCGCRSSAHLRYTSPCSMDKPRLLRTLALPKRTSAPGRDRTPTKFPENSRSGALHGRLHSCVLRCRFSRLASAARMRTIVRKR